MTIIAPNCLLFACIAHIFLTEKATWLEPVGVLVSICGIILISLAHVTTAYDKQLDYHFGVLLASMVALGSAVTSVLSSKIKEVNRSSLLFLHMGVGSLMTAGLLSVDRKDTPFFRYEETSTYFLLFVGSVGHFVATHMWTYAAMACHPATIALLRNVSILFGFAADFALFSQQFTVM